MIVHNIPNYYVYEIVVLPVGYTAYSEDCVIMHIIIYHDLLFQ